MRVVNLLQRKIERRAKLLCEARNQGLPVGIGKSSFESIENGVQFIKHHYKLDSCQCDYSTIVAKITWNNSERIWNVFVPDEDNHWVPYPFLSNSHDLTAVIREVEKDPKSVFWS